MKRRSVLSIVMLTMLALAACSKEEPATGDPAAGVAAAPAEDAVSKIPILPGYKYYVGGPVMKEDPYGRFRISSFNGEVQQPPSRGMIFGVKRDGDQLEYKVWGNGVLLGLHRGVMRDGIFRQEYAEGYRQGKLVAREKTVYDDEAKRSKLTTEDIDADNGEVIRTRESSVSYLPPAFEEEDDEGDDEDEDDEDDEEGEEADVVPGAKGAAQAAPGKSDKGAAK